MAFIPLEDPATIAWERVGRITLVPFLTGGVVALLLGPGGELRVPAGELRPGEEPVAAGPLRIAREVAGLRLQGLHPLAIGSDEYDVALWVMGARYAGARPHNADAQWWTGDARAADTALRAQGATESADLVALADAARCALTDEQYWADSQRVLDAAYLAAGTPEGGSGFGGTAQEWFVARSVLCDAIDRDGAFLDVGCANGHLMYCMVQWCATHGVNIEPYGVDHSVPLVASARARRPEWADRIWIGNALTWTPPGSLRFDFVHTLFDCVPGERQRELVQHLLDVTVAPGGRLIMSNYGVGPDQRAGLLLERLGFEVAGETRTPDATDGRVHQPSAWVDKPPIT